ncbi:MAG: NAD-dependent epimerase [Spirochaetales bacterium]|nr:NAD-dependent epimerase [Spirochaetales bacterium]
MKILVTGTAGFIGFHVASRLIERGDEVVGLDNINEYYDVALKFARLKASGIEKNDIEHCKLKASKKYGNYSFVRMDLSEKENMLVLFDKERFDAVCHLAAQAGVRYSLEHPQAYVDSNITGFLNVLEACRYHGVMNLSFASTSSVYGLNHRQPFSTHAGVDHPVSLYAATKKGNELMAHTYSHLFGIKTSGMRFFTVYGSWGRPDMALFLFTRAILEDKPIDVFNNGEMSRDFTYIDDIAEGVVRIIDHPAEPDPAWDPDAPDPAASSAPYRVYNLGNGSPVRLLDFIRAIENATGKKAKMNFLPMQPADVVSTHADTRELKKAVGYEPRVDIQTGIKRFVDWYREYHGI